MRSGDHSANSASYVRSCFRCALCETVCPTAVPYGQLVRQYLCELPPNDFDTFASVRKQVVEAFADCATDAYLPQCEPVKAAIPTVADGDALILAGPILLASAPYVIEQATRFLKRQGFETVVIDCNTWGLGLLEHGFKARYEEAMIQLAAAISSKHFKGVFTLDPWIQVMLQRHRDAGWCTELPVTECLVSMVLKDHAVFVLPKECVVDITPATVRLSQTVERMLSSQNWLGLMLPQSLVAGGALPIADSEAYPLMVSHAKQKAEWLNQHNDLIVTLDPLTLVRNRRAQHLFDFLN
jgi:hypothetical protein